MTKTDQRLKCQRCRHVQRFHKDGTCKAMGCKECKGFLPEGYLLPKSSGTRLGFRIVTPETMAKHLANGDDEMEKIYFSDIIWNPGLYFDTYLELGGFLLASGWVSLCQSKRLT